MWQIGATPMQFLLWQLLRICIIDVNIKIEGKILQNFKDLMLWKIATGCHSFFKENLVVLEPLQPGNTVSFFDQEQHTSPKNAQGNTNKVINLAFSSHFG